MPGEPREDAAFRPREATVPASIHSAGRAECGSER